MLKLFFILLFVIAPIPAFAEEQNDDCFILVCWFQDLLNSFNSVKINSYDCAGQFDKFAVLLIKEDYWTGNIFTGYANQFEDVINFYDNRCYTTYNSWMENSDYQYFIEQNRPSFDRNSYAEQMYNNEIPCTPETSYWCDYKEKAANYLKACSGVSPGDDPESIPKECMESAINLQSYT